MKKMCKQNQSLLYALILKDRDNPTDTITLEHAILTDHTVPNVSYFFGNLAHDITQIHKKLILSSFFLIDFSVAILDLVLESFNVQNIHIHLCCCRVIHAVAQS
jgi:hypothetical protein